MTMEWWAWVITVAGGVSAIGGAVSVISKAIRPVVSVSERLKNVELHDARDLKRFDAIDTKLDEIMDEIREQRGALITLMMHNIYGNHDTELREHLTHLQNN